MQAEKIKIILHEKESLSSEKMNPDADENAFFASEPRKPTIPRPHAQNDVNFAYSAS
jgi:hypothetical protein